MRAHWRVNSEMASLLLDLSKSHRGTGRIGNWRCRLETEDYQNRGMRFRRREIIIENANRAGWPSRFYFPLLMGAPMSAFRTQLSVFRTLAPIIRKYVSMRKRVWF